MPLEKGDNPTAIGHNIETEEAHGKSHEQAVAIALHTAKDQVPVHGAIDADTVIPPQMSLKQINDRNREFWGHDWKSPSPTEKYGAKDAVYECSTCHQRFSSEEMLKTHRFLHHGVKDE